MILRTLTPFLSIIIAVLLFMFVVQPQYIEVVALQQEAEEYKSATERYQNFTKQLDEKLAKKSSRSALENERLDTLVLDEIDNVQLLVDLETMAKRQNLLFGNIGVEEGDEALRKVTDSTTATGEELITSDISFEVVGTYEQFKEFLREIEGSLTLFEVVKIELNSPEESMFQQFALTVRVYALPKS